MIGFELAKVIDFLANSIRYIVLMLVFVGSPLWRRASASEE